MKNRLLFGLGGAVVGGAFALFIYTGGAYKRDALACSTEFNFTRNQGKANEVKVNAVAQFYFHRNGTGLTTYKGAAKAEGKSLIVDRVWGGDRFCMVVMWGKKVDGVRNDGGCEAR